jgi:hypothetical protein
MKTIVIIAVLMWSAYASATTYYVSSSTGSDASSGTSAASAWKTMAKVNGQTLQPGDSILLKRGDVWNESLAPANSGAAGNPITYDAYGTGLPPNLSGYYAVPSSAWVLVSGNAWKAPLPAGYSTINFCLFGSVWGQKVGASTSNLTDQWDFYFANGYLYVYSGSGNPGNYYGAPIVPMALSNVRHQREREVVVDVSAFAGELVRSIWRLRAGGERSPGFRKHGNGFDDSAGDSAVGLLFE